MISTLQVNDMFIPICLIVSLLQTGVVSVDLTYFVDENHDPKTLIGDIAADTSIKNRIAIKDQHLLQFIQLKQESKGFQLFHVSKKTGQIFLNQTLDAESLCAGRTECWETVEVIIQKAMSFERFLEIQIRIQDTNDHRPEFPNITFEVKFSEGDWIGMKRPIPSAVDRDISALNSLITYQLETGDYKEVFHLDVSESVDGNSKLAIVLKKKLDREIQDSYNVRVVAKDGGLPSHLGFLDVFITVTDINDNPPVFSQKVYSVSVDNKHQDISSSERILILTANDADAGKNGRVFYHFSSKNLGFVAEHLELNELTGEIFLIRTFNTGRNQTFKIYVVAKDAGNPSLSSVAMILVKIQNAFNKAPTIELIFLSETQEDVVNISEDTEIGTFLTYVKVVDTDDGLNGEVRCHLDHEKFQLETLGINKYKVVLRSLLDREIADQYDVTVSCQDRGFQPQRSESKFSVHVIDVNDVKPRFSNETFTYRIDENWELYTWVGIISAVDSDQGASGALIYSLTENAKALSLPFNVSDDGVIFVDGELDYESQNIYAFQVLVKDNGTPSLNSTANVLIEVIDKNDNAPYIIFPNVHNYSLNVSYCTQRHIQNVIHLQASDNDSQENAFLKYEITAGNDMRLFTIDPFSGMVSSTGALFEEGASSYELEIMVQDHGNPVLSASTSILINVVACAEWTDIEENDQKENAKANYTFHQKQDVVIKNIEGIIKLNPNDTTDDPVSFKHKISMNILIIIVGLVVILTMSFVLTTIVCFFRYSDKRNVFLKRVTKSNKPITEKRYVTPKTKIPLDIMMDFAKEFGSTTILADREPNIPFPVQEHNVSNLEFFAPGEIFPFELFRIW